MRMAMTAFAIAAVMVSCQKTDNGNPDDGGETTGLEALKENTVTVNGTDKTLTGVFVDEFSGYIMITATDAPGAESFNWLYENEAEYIQILVLPSLCNKEFDVLTETDSFSIFSTYKDAPLVDGVGTGFTEGLESGLCRVNFDGENAEMFADLKLSDGSTISVRGAGKFSGEAPNESYIDRNGDKDPLRAAFYSVESGTAMFYFTPADIEYFEEIDVASYYVAVIIDEEMLSSGQTIDINSTTENFQIYYVDNLNEEMAIIGTDKTNGATGTFSIAKLAGEAEFAATMDIDFSAKLSISLDFSGVCTDMYAVPEKENEFTYDGVTSAIASALVDTSAEPWVIWLSSESGVTTVEGMQSADAVKITAPEEAFSGEPVGFSTYKETLSFAYKGIEWNYNNDAIGTLTASLDGTTLSVEFTNYGNLNGYYSGEAVVIK